MRSFFQLIRHNGNMDLFHSVEMSVAALVNGVPLHIHAEGLRGTGKTTIMRAAREILPPIIRIKHCLYNCDPRAPHCPEHRKLSKSEIESIGTELIPRPFLEISHAAKIGTVVGSIDLGKLIDKNNPAAAFLPGTIPQAHRGVIFVDEINRLADTSPELADILLDVMGTKPGRIQLEETGFPVVDLPVSVTIWAASNPDEEPGALTVIRKQLADRFDLAVTMGRPCDYSSVLAIMNQQEPEEQDRRSLFVERFDRTLNDICIEQGIRNLIAAIYIDFGLESLRAVEALETAAALTALLAGKRAVEAEDLATVVPLVLGHRADNTTITNILKYLAGNMQPSLDLGPTGVQGKGTAQSGSEIISRPITQEQALSWWSRLFNRLRRKLLSGRLSNKPEDGSFEGKKEKNRVANTAVGNASTPQVVDPAQTPISAPPKPATPLTNFSADHFVSGEDNKSHG